MSGTNITGIYGKLPAYGDFIFRNLKANFINTWDEWLQHYVSGSQEQLGENWLNIYLTSPIWRFVLSPGVIDENLWAGVMTPSVDRVGRYFPISVLNAFPAYVNPIDLMLSQSEWFLGMEEHCLTALNGEIDADQLVEQVSGLTLSHRSNYYPTASLGGIGPMVIGMSGCDSQQMQNLLPSLANANLVSSLSSYSVWATSGSDLVAPALFCCQGLPPIAGIASMLDGQWQARHWNVPYNAQLA